MSEQNGKLYWKITNPDGSSFHDPETIYKAGETVSMEVCMDPQLCSSDVLHASRTIASALKYANFPLALHRVLGEEVVSDDDKSGFFSLRVIKTVPDSELDEKLGFHYHESLKPVNPMQIESIPNDDDWKLVDEWDSIRASIRASIRDSVGDSVWISVGDSFGDSAWISVRDSVWDSIWDFVGDSIRASIWASIRDFVRDSVWVSIRDSVWDSVWAYIGNLFPNIKKWKYIEHKKDKYPFQPAVDLWYRGIVPVLRGNEWMLVTWKDGKCILHKR